MQKSFFLLIVLIALSCKKDNPTLQENILSDYLELNNDLGSGDIIACAGGKEGGLFGIAEEPTSVFFYPIKGASDFRYFEAENIADSLDFSKYFQKDLEDEPVFNGYLWKFNNLPFTGERMGIVTYKTPGKLHICTPIRQKTTLKPTEINPDLATVTESGINPKFAWDDGLLKENVIYFQVIADQSDNLISGTYTYEKEFAFYDLNNVVLNITDTTSTPVLEPNQNYKFILMGVSEDNWVNLFVVKEFLTN